MNNSLQNIKNMMNSLNPQQIAMNMIRRANNPILNNLAEMAQKGDIEGVQKFARNALKEQNRDFDSEFNKFMGNSK